MRWTALLALPLFPGALAAAEQPFRLCDDAKHARLLALIPKTDDPRMEAVRTNPRLVIYTNAEMPKASQFWDSNPLAGVHRADHNISANPQRRPDGGVSGGPAQEFPWRFPFGMDEAEGWTKFTFFLLPPGQPVRWWTQRLPGDGPRYASYRWEFPVGTVFGEVLSVQDREGWSYPFEMRVRRKLGERTWRPDVFRPFASRDELDAAVARSGDPGASAFVGSRESRAWILANQHPAKVIRNVAVEDVLPPLSQATVRQLLDRPFMSVRGREWVEGGHAPGTRADFHIVPKNYAGAAVPVSTGQCAKCHSTTLAHPDDFGPFGRDWYGRVPGDDSAFTFHPFDPASLSGNGIPQPVSLNPRMVRAGILKHWDE
jgi:hypothetical protein